MSVQLRAPSGTTAHLRRAAFVALAAALALVPPSVQGQGSPADSGAFTLANVPAGAYTLVAWHERVGDQPARVSVQPGQSTTLEIALPVADLP